MSEERYPGDEPGHTFVIRLHEEPNDDRPTVRFPIPLGGEKLAWICCPWPLRPGESERIRDAGFAAVAFMKAGGWVEKEVDPRAPNVAPLNELTPETPSDPRTPTPSESEPSESRSQP